MGIDLFAEPDNEEYNMVGDEMENPFFGTAPAGTQQMTLPAQVASPFSPFRGTGLGSQQPQLGQGNPLEAWLTMWAPIFQQYQQQHAEFKEHKKHKMANLTCVLRKFDALNSNLG